ncbi:MAG: hypothetical protein ACFCD0_15310 [Gemmataceae bacterium]
MTRLAYGFGWAFIGFVTLTLVPPTNAEPLPRKYRKSVRKALEYLAKAQKDDGQGGGYWEGNGGKYSVAMTGLTGMALLMEGSTMRSGRYSKHIRKAVRWLISRARPNKGGSRDGLIGGTQPRERIRYMYGHGFAMLFLSSVYGNEAKAYRREELKDILTRAVQYTVNAQSTNGGWYYKSAKESNDADEGSVTITQVQALRAARNAGIPVPIQSIKLARRYLQRSTTTRGGVIYKLRRGGGGVPTSGGRPALTAAAIACAFSAGQYKGDYIKKWFKYCHTLGKIYSNRGHDEYTKYYYAQAVYVLGDDGWAKLFGKDASNPLKWTAYRKKLFDSLVAIQSSNGSWNRSGIGPVYSTSLYATIMQLDRATIPIYQR